MVQKNSSSFSFKLGRSALLMAVLMGTSTLASASGSFGPSSGNNSQNSYNLGKRIYHTKVACDTCPLPSGRLDKQGAMTVVDQLNSNNAVIGALSKKERKAVAVYLKKRHKLN